MNPTVQRIQELFYQNDPNHYYWGNFQKFLQGHSQKAIANLLNAPAWKPPQARALLAMTQRITIQTWLSSSENRQNWLLLTTANIRRTVNFDGTPQLLRDFTFNTVKPCWLECDAHTKFQVWNHWGSGIKNADIQGQLFMLDCMQAWEPQTSLEVELKMQALVGTFDELTDTSKHSSISRDGAIKAYSELLHKEIKRFNYLANFSPASVQTWRQLQGYPDFLEAMHCQHPWMQSLSVVHTGVMASNLPEAIVFHKQEAGHIVAIRKERVLKENPLNDDDALLAKALLQHFLNQTVTAAPSVQGLYGLLEGLDNSSMLSCLLNLNNIEQTASMDIDNDVFDCTL